MAYCIILMKTETRGVLIQGSSVKKSFWGTYVFTLTSVEFVIALLPAIYYFLIRKQLPEIVPIHYNIQGIADGFASLYGGEVMFLYCIPIFMMCGSILLRKHQDIASSHALQYIMMSVTGFFSVVMIYVISIMGDAFFNPFFIRVLLVGISVLFMVMGHYIPKVPRNKWLGVRTKYSLSNDDAWREVQVFGGKFMFLGGVIVLLLNLVPFISEEVLIYLSVGIFLVTNLWGVFGRPKKLLKW